MLRAVSEVESSRFHGRMVRVGVGDDGLVVGDGRPIVEQYGHHAGRQVRGHRIPRMPLAFVEQHDHFQASPPRLDQGGCDRPVGEAVGLHVDGPFCRANHADKQLLAIVPRGEAGRVGGVQREFLGGLGKSGPRRQHDPGAQEQRRCFHPLPFSEDITRPFAGRLEQWSHPTFDDSGLIAARIRALLAQRGWSLPAEPD